MDSFDDQNFGHILRDLGDTHESKEHFNTSVIPQEAVDDYVDLSDQKILTPLEIPKSKSQLNFCKSLTEKLKNDEPPEFSLTEIEPCDLVKDLYSQPEAKKELYSQSVTKNDSYLIPNPSSNIPNEIPRTTQETAIFEDPARLEIIACLSDFPSELPESHTSNNNPEVVVASSGDKADKHLDVSQDETKITRSKFFLQKRKSSNPTTAAKRKTDGSSIHDRSTKHRVVKPDVCLYYPGMIVWAKISGYSFWPAMIDNDPDCNSFTWPIESSTFTHYHVVFFDTNGRLSRSWVKTHNLKLFTELVRISNSRPKDYIERFKRSVKEAKEALNLTLEERLRKYSFKERLKLPGTILCQD